MVKEEKIVHSRQGEEKIPLAAKGNVPSIKALPRERSRPLKDKSRSTPQIFLWFSLIALIFLAFLYFRENPFVFKPKPEPAAMPVAAHEEKALSPVTPGDDRQELTALSLNQQETIRQLKKEIQSITLQLRSEQKRSKQFESQEKDYRDELYQLALKYQEELLTLKQENLEKEGKIRDLRSGLQEAEVTIQKTQESRYSGAPSQQGTVHSEQGLGVVSPDPVIQGKVVLVNSRYAFVVINLGAKQGIRPEQKVVFYLKGKAIGSGSIEKVYPGLSGVAVLGPDALARIQEGEAVSVTL